MSPNPSPAKGPGPGAPDPNTCRRALREINEIAAVARLQDSRMTQQEALQTIAAIAEWVDDEQPRSREACGEVVRRLHVLTDDTDFDGLDDREAVDLFAQVVATLRARYG